MATLTLDGLWPVVGPRDVEKSKRISLMDRFIAGQERRARARIADILGTYDVDSLRRTGIAEDDIRRLIASRFIGTR